MVDPGEVDDDLVRDVTEILSSLCALRYGRRAAANRAARAVARPSIRFTTGAFRCEKPVMWCCRGSAT